MPHLGMRQWYNNTSPDTPHSDVQVTWGMLLSCWAAIELDLHDKGIDCEKDLDSHSWRWFELHVLDLVETGRRLPDALRAIS